jgi:hypothetical protein
MLLKTKRLIELPHMRIFCLERLSKVSLALDWTAFFGVNLRQYSLDEGTTRLDQDRRCQRGHESNPLARYDCASKETRADNGAWSKAYGRQES